MSTELLVKFEHVQQEVLECFFLWSCDVWLFLKAPICCTSCAKLTATYYSVYLYLIILMTNSVNEVPNACIWKLSDLTEFLSCLK